MCSDFPLNNYDSWGAVSSINFGLRRPRPTALAITPVLIVELSRMYTYIS